MAYIAIVVVAFIDFATNIHREFVHLLVGSIKPD